MAQCVGREDFMNSTTVFGTMKVSGSVGQDTMLPFREQTKSSNTPIWIRGGIDDNLRELVDDTRHTVCGEEELVVSDEKLQGR
jgi:hypothetical protein